MYAWPMTKAARDVLAERKRQINGERYTPEHDMAEHCNGELARAASCYALQAVGLGDRRSAEPRGWPSGWVWKPKSPREDLVRAAALLLAELERLDRLYEGKTDSQEKK